MQMLPLKQQTVTFYCNLLQGTAECMHAMFKSQIKYCHLQGAGVKTMP